MCTSDVGDGRRALQEEGEPRTRCLAHSRNRFGQDDLLSAHLQGVAQRAASFAEPFGGGAEADLAGLLHDLGKYGELFQGYRPEGEQAPLSSEQCRG